MALLAAEQGLVAAEIAPIVRRVEETVRRWLARHSGEGVECLPDAPRSVRLPRAAPAYREWLLKVVRRPRARSACRSRCGPRRGSRTTWWS